MLTFLTITFVVIPLMPRACAAVVPTVTVLPTYKISSFPVEISAYILNILYLMNYNKNICAGRNTVKILKSWTTQDFKITNTLYEISLKFWTH